MERLTRYVTFVRWALLVRMVLVTTALVGLVAALTALLVVLLVPTWPRWPWLGAPALGVVAGAWLARLRMPAEAELVQFVDRRLEGGESVLSAWEARQSGASSPFDALALRRAEEVLARGTRRRVQPRIAQRALVAAPLALIVYVSIFFVPVPVAPTGTDEVRLDATTLLRPIERLADSAEDDAEMREVADRARELRERLVEGMPQREALDEIDELRRAVEETRREETPEERRARDRAIDALADESEMSRALGERDLESLDRAVERAASRLEAESRERARESLRRAAEAARAEGDEALADRLMRSERLLARRAEQAELARELAEAMPEVRRQGLERQLERLSRDGDGSELNREMVDAMREAWSRLSPEERARLGERLSQASAAENDAARERREGEDGGPMSADEYERMLREALDNLDRLSVAAGGPGPRFQVAASRARATDPARETATETARRRARGEAIGPATAEGTLGKVLEPPDPITIEVVGQAAVRRDPLEGGQSVLARVRPGAGDGAPSRSWTEWIDPVEQGSAGGTSAGGATRAVEGSAGGVTRDPIPEDYREHVRRYFGDGE